VSGGGRARRGLSVIVAQKIHVNVNSTGILGIYWSDWRKQSFLDGKQAFLGVSCGRLGWSKRAFLSDMDVHVNVH